MQTKFTSRDVKQINPDKQIGIVRFSPCGKLLVAGSFEGEVLRWDASTDAFAPLPPWTGHSGWVQGLVIHPDARRLFTADSWGQLRATSCADGKILWFLPQAHDGWVRALVLSPDGKQLATCGRDRKIRLWSAVTGTVAGELTLEEDPLTMIFTPDGLGLVVGDQGGSVKQWDLAGKKVVRAFDAKVLHTHDRITEVGGVRSLALDRKTEVLAVCGGQPAGGGFVTGVPVVLFFDWKTGALKHKATLGTDRDVYVLESAFHPDGFLMAVCSGQPGSGKVFFLVPGETQPLFTKSLANCHSLSLHPTLPRLVVSSTNGNSAGNGAVIKDMKYAGNYSPLNIVEFAKV